MEEFTGEFVRGTLQTLTTHWMASVAVLALMFLIGVLVSASRLPQSIKALVWLALILRVVGSVTRFQILQLHYEAGDATGYFARGWTYAKSFRQFDFSRVGQSGDWYGTEFVRTVSGAVLAFIGPSMFAEFLVFSLFAFIGLVGFAVAFRRAYPNSPITGYLIWIWVFPSLWFWPSSIGKDALVLMGLGIAVMGFIGERNRVNWLFLVLGVLLMFSVRPEIVTVFIMAVLIAQWLSFGGRWTSKRVIQGALLLVVGIIGIRYAMTTIGIEEIGVEGVQEFVEGGKSRQVTRGTSVEVVTPDLSGAPMAAVNVLFRPFPWEAGSPMVLISSLEILSLWVIVFLRRKNLGRLVSNWRSDRFIRLAVVFILLYSVAFGLMVFNLGIIARQRIFIFPFLFLLIEAGAAEAIEVRSRRNYATNPQPPSSLRTNRIHGTKPNG